MQIDGMIEALLNEPVVNDDNTITFEQAEEYAKDLSAEQMYVDMLVKIVKAPTTLHMKCSARMLIPIIDRKLKERGL